MGRNIYIGIDPGQKGGIAAIGDGVFVLCPLEIPAKLTERDVADCLLAFRNSGVAILERVGPNRQAAKGERRQGASTMFQFGKGYGFLRGLLIAHAIPFHDVTPQKWQKVFGLMRRDGESDTEKKNRHKAIAQQMWPEQKQITHWQADALLLSEYGRRTLTTPQHAEE